MARQKYNYLSDELIAESLQVTNYLEQSRSSRLNCSFSWMERNGWKTILTVMRKPLQGYRFHIISLFELLYSKNGMVFGRCKGVVVCLSYLK